ncbi:MAG TPA: hypothetical protein VM369_12200 [Candidatus Binatia bacterium]|nr:hypothetical protein [Candidatus Binatia bacterium]
MRKGFLGVAAGLALIASAHADVLSLPEGEPVPQIKLPAKGLSQAEVTKQFGEPRRKQQTVGGTAPKQPPITRWDYDGYSVIFERDRIVDVVVPGAPPKIYDKDKLEAMPVASAPAATGADESPAAPEAPAAATPDAETAPGAAPADGTQKLSPQVHEEPAPATPAH